MIRNESAEGDHEAGAQLTVPFEELTAVNGDVKMMEWSLLPPASRCAKVVVGKYAFEAKGCVAWAGIGACRDEGAVEKFLEDFSGHRYEKAARACLEKLRSPSTSSEVNRLLAASRYMCDRVFIAVLAADGVPDILC